MKRRTLLLGTLAVAVIVVFALVAIAAAGGTKGSPVKSATPVFKLSLKPSQEVPPLTGLRASGRGNVTFDLTRDSQGVITDGEVVFYVNYRFSGPVTIIGLHIHVGAKGTNGPIVVDSGVTAFEEPDGRGNITTVVTAGPALLQAILDNPRGYYVNLHTTDNPGGAMRDQLRRPVKF
jgi:CHRD domain